MVADEVLGILVAGQHTLPGRDNLLWRDGFGLGRASGCAGVRGLVEHDLIGKLRGNEVPAVSVGVDPDSVDRLDN